jgi:hypothetical protein
LALQMVLSVQLVAPAGENQTFDFFAIRSLLSLLHAKAAYGLRILFGKISLMKISLVSKNLPSKILSRTNPLSFIEFGKCRRAHINQIQRGTRNPH